MAGDRSPIAIGRAEIDRAAQAGRGLVVHTPLARSAILSERVGGDIALKAEILQRTGSFKLRGAMSKIASLGDAAAHGVIAGSAGNHAQALALAARTFGVRCEIFVPLGASISKVAACREMGASIVEVGDSVDDAVDAARARARDAGMEFCHPFDDAAVIAGQATLGDELVHDVADLRRVVLPLGGGGLVSGVAIALKLHDPTIHVVGVQARRCAPWANVPVEPGPIVTLADGIAVKHPGELTAPLVERWVDDIVTVDEDAIADAMVLLMDHSKLLVEGAGAVGVAALLAGHVAPARSGTTCVVLSGGNVDLGIIPGLIGRHETTAGRRLIAFVRISDQPGTLARLLALFAAERANLLEVQHVREGIDLHVRETGVHVALEVRGPDHATRVLDAARAAGYHIEVASHI